MATEFVVRLNDSAVERLDRARKRFGVATLDQFILRALALAERQAALIQPDGTINVMDGDPDVPETEVVALQVRTDLPGAAADTAGSRTAQAGTTPMAGAAL